MCGGRIYITFRYDCSAHVSDKKKESHCFYLRGNEEKRKKRKAPSVECRAGRDWGGKGPCCAPLKLRAISFSRSTRGRRKKHRNHRQRRRRRRVQPMGSSAVRFRVRRFSGGATYHSHALRYTTAGPFHSKKVRGLAERFRKIPAVQKGIGGTKRFQKREKRNKNSFFFFF